MKMSRKLVEAVQGIKYCTHNIHLDDNGREVSVSIPYPIFQQLMKEYDDLILILKNKALNQGT